MSLNRSIGYAFAAMVIAVSTSACMQEELPGDETGVELEAVVSPEQQAESGDQSLWTLEEDGSQGLLEEDGSQGLLEEAPGTEAGCVHIQWCNESGYWGTVCIWDACSFAAALSECTADANYVCGGITQPAQVRR